MIILRLFLYLLCIISIGWSLLVFGGPTLIKRIINISTNGAVIPANISVSPTLDVSFGRLDFNFSNAQSISPVKGFARSTEMSWSIATGMPFLTLDFGPTFVENIGIAENISFHTASLNKLDWQDLFVVLRARGINLQSYGKVDDLVIEANCSQGLDKLYNIKFDAKRAGFQMDSLQLSASTLNGALDQFDLSSSISNQKFSAKLSLSDIKSDKNDLTVAAAYGVIDGQNDEKFFEIDFQEVQIDSLGGRIEKISVDGDYFDHSGFKNVRVDLENGALVGGSPSFSLISTKTSKINDNEYNSHIEGGLDQFDLSGSDNYLGQMPPSNFNVDLNFNKTNYEIKAKSEINLESTGLSAFYGSAAAVLSFDRSAQLMECFNADCKLSAFDFSYKVYIEDDWIKGNSLCPLTSCNFGTMTHFLKTSNTINILANLGQEGLLSPLSSLYLYSAIGNGQKVKNGHEFKF